MSNAGESVPIASRNLPGFCFLISVELRSNRTIIKFFQDLRENKIIQMWKLFPSFIRNRKDIYAQDMFKFEELARYAEFTNNLASVGFSFAALLLSFFAFAESRKASDISGFVGQAFGIAQFTPDNFENFGLPYFNMSGTDKFLLVDLSIIFVNSGARDGVVSDLKLDITHIKTGATISLYAEATFELPTSSSPLRDFQLFTPIPVQPHASTKRLVRFTSNRTIADGFWVEGDYLFEVSIRRPNTEKWDRKSLYTKESVVFKCTDDSVYSIDIKTFVENAPKNNGDTALVFFNGKKYPAVASQ